MAQRAAGPNAACAPGRVTVAGKLFARALNEHISRKLLAFRLQRRKTQREMARICGMSTQQISKYEQGLAKVPPDKLWLLATAFGIDLAYFFEGFDPAEIVRQPPVTPASPPDDPAASRRRIALALDDVTSVRKLQVLADLVQTIADVPER